ncbi:MAG: phosphoribosyltransferase family protein [Candidatus Nealsonbacteria bacterium]|nr:phosphoribosyltransferase family protein [Candidatus Nealsonbacteria bacterium]
MINNLSELNPDLYNFGNMLILPGTIISWFKKENAYWHYQGDPSPEKPHAELSSGLCSNGFFDCQRILCYPNVAEILAFQLACEIKFFMNEEKIKKIDYVVAPAYAAIPFGHEVAKALGAKFVFTEKDPSDPKGKKMLWQRMAIPTGANVLQVDELITTASTIKEVRRAVQEGNPDLVTFVPFVGTIVFRPENLKAKQEYEIISLIKKEVQNFEPGQCPYCKAGSLRVRPKKNWDKLTGKK